jgi:2',3'-cyclic-nucleotide 2'-phosphodiesterase (5'-nucleotidase family)
MLLKKRLKDAMVLGNNSQFIFSFKAVQNTLRKKFARVLLICANFHKNPAGRTRRKKYGTKNK